ncbi:MAG: hypothetical protein HY304_00080 [candidate division Zixibacteria bacterium]|nr:hypothetical protein [candidate division Zixibacteria bacterium]
MSDSERHMRGRGASMTGGLIVTGVGLIFLLSNMRIIPSIGRVWPLFMIVVGVALLVGALRGRGSTDSTTVPPSPPQ